MDHLITEIVEGANRLLDDSSAACALSRAEAVEASGRLLPAAARLLERLSALRELGRDTEAAKAAIFAVPARFDGRVYREEAASSAGVDSAEEIKKETDLGLLLERIGSLEEEDMGSFL